MLAPRQILSEGVRRPPLVPWFLLGFAGLVLLNSLHLVPSLVQTTLSDASRWCIAAAIAALGVKTSLAALAQVGPRAVALMILETLFIAGLVLARLKLA